MGFSTTAIHGGQEPDPSTGAIITPIFQTSTFVQEGLGKDKGYVYARTHNPTRTVLEHNVAALEGARFGLAFASGMAAISAIMTVLREGDHVVCSENVYGGTFRLFDQVLQGYGLSFTYVDTSDVRNVEKALRADTRLIYIETPTNPLLVLTDIAAAAQVARAHGLRLVVDNTFLSPYFQNPLALGAHIVIHSSTKYLNGHSDVVGGVVVTSDEEGAERIRFVQNSVGAVPGPFDCWLVLRGIKTLALRMREHDRNGRAVAEYLAAHPKVRKVYYPGLPSHPQHDLARRQQRGFGGMVSFETGSLEAARRVMERVRVFSLAESLGAVESLVCHPATMTHASVPPEERERMGITDGLVRLSVGIEDPEDLIADLEQALQ